MNQDLYNQEGREFTCTMSYCVKELDSGIVLGVHMRRVLEHGGKPL